MILGLNGIKGRIKKKLDNGLLNDMILKGLRF